jgi:hypothetical protein
MGPFPMLTAYFDDSGTHVNSNIVLVAGIFGTEWQLKSLDRLWQKHIVRPLNGAKPPLRRFHATDCQNSTNEFAGWTRTETDYFSHELRTAIIGSGVSACGIGIQRKDWDELITGHLRGFLGDAESYAITQCYVCALRWAQQNAFDPEMTFVFDNRPSEIQRRAKTVGDAFERHSTNPRVVGCQFASPFDICPLQAADLFAWEIYQHATEIFSSGMIHPPKREALRRLNANIKMTTQLATRGAIRQIADYISSQSPDYLKAASNHFVNSDPVRPDYSHLAGRPSKP